MKAKHRSISTRIPAQISPRFVWAFATCALIAGIGFFIISDSSQTRAEDQLAGEVRALNAALEVHRIFRGELDSADSVTEVLAQLQGFDVNDTLVDHRLCAEDQNSEDAASGAPRAVWNRLTERFEITHGVVRGVKRFYFDENPDRLRIAANEKRRIDKLDFEANDSWIWNQDGDAKPVVAPLTMLSSKPARSAN